MTPHIHVSAVHLLTFVATLVVVNFTVRTVAARHADSPFWQGAAYVV